MNQPRVTCIPHPNPPLPPPSPSHPSGSSQCTRSEHLSHASNLGWCSVSPLIVYLFQCCSLRASHPCLLPQSLKVCFVHLCLFFCSFKYFSSVQLIAIPWTAACQASVSVTNSQSPHKSMPLSQQCHPNISSSVVSFSSCPQSFPASGSFPMSQFFAPSGQNIGASVSASVLPMNIQDWSPLGWTDWISLQYKGLSRVFSNTTVQKHQFLGAQLSSQFNSHIHTRPLEIP